MITQIVSFTLLGKPHTIKTTENPETIKATAALVDEKIRLLAAKHDMEPSESLGFLAALELAGELYKLRKDYQRLMSLAEEDNE